MQNRSTSLRVMKNTKAGPGFTDPYYAQVVVLAHFNDTPGSSSFVNQSVVSGAPTITNNGGNITTTSSQSKFGTGSLSFPGTSFASITHSAAGNIGTQDFTLEFWVKPTSGSGINYLVDYNGGFFNTTAFGFCLMDLNNRLTFFSRGSNIGDGALPLDGNFHACALSRQGSTMRMFVDGTIVLSSVDNYNYQDANSAGIILGDMTTPQSGSSRLNGYMDELRLTIGVSRYNANYTPSALPFAL